MYKYPTTLPCEMSMLKNRHVWRNKHYIIHYQKVVYIGHIKKSHDPLYITAATKKSCRSKMPYLISSRSVTDGVSLSVSKSKLVYSSWIFLDN